MKPDSSRIQVEAPNRSERFAARFGQWEQGRWFI